MEHLLPKYYQPLKTKKEPKKDLSEWEKAKKLYEEKSFKKAIIAVFNYNNKNTLKGVDLTKDINITRFHGDIALDISIDNSELTVSAKMVSIDKDTNVVALLRRVAEINFALLDYVSITFENNLLSMNYVEKIDRCKPLKVNWILQEFLFAGDEHLNEFIEKYNAKSLSLVKKEELTTAQQEKVLKAIRGYLSEYDSYVDYFENNGRSSYVWDIALITLYKISNMNYLNGYLKYELINKISILNNEKIEFKDKLIEAKKYIKSLQEKSDEFYLERMFFREDIISLLKISSVDILKEYLGGYFDSLAKYESEQNDFAKVYYLQVIFLRVIYNYNISAYQKKQIEKALRRIAKDNIKKGSENLIILYNKFMRKEIKERYSFKFTTAKLFYLLIIGIVSVEVINALFK